MKKRRIFTFIILFITLGLFGTLLTSVEVNASAPFKTRTLNRYGDMVDTQDAYEPILSKKIIEIEGVNESVNKPQDLFIDKDDIMYLADTDNKRIIIMDTNFNHITTFGVGILDQPLGIFVRDDKIYVADYGVEEDRESGRIVVFTFNQATYKVDEVNYKVFKTPQSPLLQVDNFVYRPQKIAVDQNHTMYVVSKGSSNGILLINNNNRFLNFFAPNPTTGTFWDSVKSFVYGGKENVILTKKIPPAPTNVMLDDSGYIYTVTSTVVQNNLGDTIKKVNIGGLNFYPEDMNVSASFIDSWSSDYKTVYALTSNGFIYEYDIEGNLLFRFGGNIAQDEQLGLFKGASSIAVDSKGNLYIVDPLSNAIQVFKKTLFTEKVHNALSLYMSGKYIESEEIWEDVLRYNSMFDLAHKGIGMAHYLNGNYREAMDKFETAYAKEEYSEAFWEVRNIFLMKHLAKIFVALISLGVVILVIRKLNKRYFFLEPVVEFKDKVMAKKPVKDALIFFRFIKRPYDTIYDIRVDKSIKVYNGFIMLGAVILVHILNITLTGFLFNSVILEHTFLLREVMKIVFPIGLFIIANYLVSSLMSGEGTLRCIFMNTMGALIPVVVMLPFIVLISNVLTYNEGFIYWFAMGVMIAWTAILLVATIKETHNFSGKQTFLNLLITIIMMLIIVIVIILVYSIVAQLYGFISDIIKEVIF